MKRHQAIALAPVGGEGNGMGGREHNCKYTRQGVLCELSLPGQMARMLGCQRMNFGSTRPGVVSRCRTFLFDRPNHGRTRAGR